PSVLAAAIRASRPPTSAADFAFGAATSLTDAAGLLGEADAISLGAAPLGEAAGTPGGADGGGVDPQAAPRRARGAGGAAGDGRVLASVSSSVACRPRSDHVVGGSLPVSAPSDAGEKVPVARGQSSRTPCRRSSSWTVATSTRSRGTSARSEIAAATPAP